MLLSQYVNRCNWHQTSNQEMLNNLRPVEQVLMKTMDLVQVADKRNRRVSILITAEVKTSEPVSTTTFKKEACRR